jgi:hypothetical protein
MEYSTSRLHEQKQKIIVVWEAGAGIEGTMIWKHWCGIGFKYFTHSSCDNKDGIKSRGFKHLTPVN